MAQTVKEVLQSLVDDSLVAMEKIGTSNYFFSFPSAALQSRRNKIDQLAAELARAERHIGEAEQQLGLARAEREETAERAEAAGAAGELDARSAALGRELESFRDLDPDLFDASRQRLSQLRSSANLWTENIFTLQAHLADKFLMERAAVEQHFELDPELDYL